MPALPAEREPQGQPGVVFFVGQPGAGESRVNELVAERLNARGGFVGIDSDRYKPFRPAYDGLMARDDTLG
ncbi:zeta toxin family protein [Streptomyces sp. XM4193]|uniref:zeta toxin family protein n=1 Tax=Streptomyces sp. XM4193 TaxID=2929782 RepID=UPI001FF911FC|nr:zeta toxin family protein [Streptomyces sp. XM4193]MCK1795713.1 zeta toxin family protein [Streptomyces sp. XM4193]